MILENEYLKVAFKSVGAEMISIFDKRRGLELLWQGDAASWRGQATNIFPFVARLKDGTYTYQGKEYSLGTHGFARGSDFAVAIEGDKAEFTLLHNEQTRAVFPFLFKFRVIYKLTDNRLSITYAVKNIGEEDMYFGVGAHPGFNIPYIEGDTMTNIKGNNLEFEQTENPMVYTFENESHLILDTEPYGECKTLELSKEIFSKDAILLKDLKSKYVTLKRSDGVDIRFWFFDAPYLAFWSHATRGGYVCIEPWCGLPDYYLANKELSQKPAINKLAANQEFLYTHDIEVLG